MREVLFKNYTEKVINSIDRLELNDSLLYLDSILENSEVKDILNGGKSLEKTYKYLNEKLGFINKYKYGFYVEEIDNQDVIEGAKALITAKYFISKGINRGDLKEIIKGILILNYFELPFGQLIEIEDFTKEERRVLSIKLKEFLSALSIKISMPNDAPYNEKRYFEEYENGIREKNMKKVYDFIEAIKRGRGYGLREVMRGLIKFISFINPILLKRTISERTDPLEILAIIEPLEDDEKLIMGLGEDIKNEWVLVGIIYQILDNNRNKRLGDNVLDAMRTILDQLWTINEELFFQCINYFGNYEDFNIILGRVLGRANRETILKYVSSYRISEYRGDWENDRLFIENFMNESEEENSLFLCSEMFKKWERYLKDFIKQNKYIQGPIYTNCFYMIVYYFLLRKNQQEDFLQELEKIIFEILEINYIWCESPIEIRARFFINLTYLYLLSIECRHKAYVLATKEELVSKLQMFFKDERIWLYYFNTLDKPSFLKEIEENFTLTSNG